MTPFGGRGARGYGWHNSIKYARAGAAIGWPVSYGETDRRPRASGYRVLA